MYVYEIMLLIYNARVKFATKLKHEKGFISHSRVKQVCPFLVLSTNFGGNISFAKIAMKFYAYRNTFKCELLCGKCAQSH